MPPRRQQKWHNLIWSWVSLTFLCEGHEPGESHFLRAAAAFGTAIFVLVVGAFAFWSTSMTIEGLNQFWKNLTPVPMVMLGAVLLGLPLVACIAYSAGPPKDRSSYCHMSLFGFRLALLIIVFCLALRGVSAL